MGMVTVGVFAEAGACPAVIGVDAASLYTDIRRSMD